MKDKMNFPALRWMLSVVGRQKYNILLLALVQTVLGVSVVGYAFFLRGLIDGAVAGDSPAFLRYAVLLIALVLFLVGLRSLKRFLVELARSTMENRFKENLFHNLLRKDYGQVTAVHSAEWMNRLTNDTKVVADGLSEVLPDLCEMFARLVAAIASLVVLQPKFAYILLPGGLLVIALTYVFRNRLKRLHKTIQEKDGELRVFYQERLNSQTVLRVFGKEPQTEDEEAAYLAAHKGARMKRNRFSNFANAGFGLLMSGAYVFAAIWCGAGILHGTMSYGTFTAVLQLVGQVQTPFANFSRAFPQYFAMVASAERLQEVEALPDADISGTTDASGFETFGLHDVSFAYDDVSALDHFSVTVNRGEVVAFTGPSGCGKSTALKLILGLYHPQSGTAFGGADRSLFAYVPQGNDLIRGTIREVVAFGDTDAMQDDERIWAALRVACADEFVRSLGPGLDTQLGEQGAGLSEGQMQRLSIARAVFADRPVLLLDESTSALDAATEAQLLQNLKQLPDRTIVIVTHRPAALQIADKIIEF